jgi:signal transduction histidine kinase
LSFKTADIDDLKEKINELASEKEKLFAVLSNLKEGIVVADPLNRILVVNEAASEFLNIRTNKLLRRSLKDFTENELGFFFEPLIQEKEVSDQTVVQHKSRILSFRVFFPKNQEGRLIAKGLVLRDITESQRVEELRKVFVANASHELRSPAAGLQALLDAFEVGGLENQDSRTKFMTMMNREVNRLNAIIQDLLDLSEMEREKEFAKESLDIVKLFKEWLSFYETRIQEKSLRLVFNVQEEKISLTASAADLERLFRNLMENALKYSPAGGSLEIGIKNEKTNILGWVKDSGIGIPEEHLSRIFERFYRVDKSRSRALGGTGLGLSIAKHAVERHGGKIWAESKENQGAVFYFTLPFLQGS